MENAETTATEQQATEQAELTAQLTAQQPKTYSESELQSEVDRRVSQAMEKAKRKTDAKVKEAEKLAKMNAEERYNYELEQREQAIAAKEKELAIAENKAAASAVLANNGLDAALVPLVVAEDAETMNDNINLLSKAFKASVKREVEARLATSTPKKNLPLNQELTRESFRKLSLTEQAKLYESNPDLWTKLSH